MPRISKRTPVLSLCPRPLLWVSSKGVIKVMHPSFEAFRFRICAALRAIAFHPIRFQVGFGLLASGASDFIGFALLLDQRERVRK